MQYEYLELSFGYCRFKHYLDALNEAGIDGWKLVTLKTGDDQDGGDPDWWYLLLERENGRRAGDNSRPPTQAELDENPGTMYIVESRRPIERPEVQAAKDARWAEIEARSVAAQAAADHDAAQWSDPWHLD